MSQRPNFASTPNFAGGLVSAANSARDGSGTLVSVISAGANGTRIRRITVQATQSTTAGMVRLFFTFGGSSLLFLEVAVPAITVSATTPAFSYTISENTEPGLLPVTLPTGWSISASTEKAESFRVIIEGADL
jgi:hypothetical protein